MLLLPEIWAQSQWVPEEEGHWEEGEEGEGRQCQTRQISQSVNVHISTACIKEIDDNDDIPISLYHTAQSCWMVDSGATHHITPHWYDFITWSPAKGVVSLGGHAEISQISIGTVAIWPSRSDKIVHLHNDMHVPDAGTCYFSVSALLKKGGHITFQSSKLLISVWGHQIAKGYQEGNLFWIDSSHTALHAIGAPTPVDLWHECMGHMSYNALKLHKDAVKGITLDSNHILNTSPCTGCQLGKQVCSSFLRSNKWSDCRLQIVHSDLMGSMQMRSIQGSQYIATFMNNYSRHRVVYYLKSKDQCATVLRANDPCSVSKLVADYYTVAPSHCLSYPQLKGLTPWE